MSAVPTLAWVGIGVICAFGAFTIDLWWRRIGRDLREDEARQKAATRRS
jgi:hypothetical protein